MRKKLCCILAGAMLMSTLTLGGATVSAYDQTDLSNTSPHWGESYISRAKAEGILAGIGAEERDPDAAVTRAEFVKMTLVAMRLYPGCNTDEVLDRFMRRWKKHIPTPYDMSDHVLTNDGYTEIALNFGLISDENCTDNQFNPDDFITRYDAAKIASRMAGLVYAANNGYGSIPFIDTISESNVGTVAALAEEKILLGYEDNTMRGDNTISLAEACALLDRCIDYTEQGIDESVTVRVNDMDFTDKVTVQIIDGIVYIPYGTVILAARDLDDKSKFFEYYWDRDQQYYSFNVSQAVSSSYCLVAGSDYSTIIDSEKNDYRKLPAKCRMMRGEIMAPCSIDSEHIGSNTNVSYDANEKILDLNISFYWWNGS